MDDNAPLSAAELLELNREIQGSPTVRLLTANNLGLYATLMERHLAGGIIPETELVVLLERDLEDVGQSDGQSGLSLIKSWASQGWLHRVADTRSGFERNLCYLTQEARRALDFLRGMRRKDTIATGGSINGIASRLKQVAIRVGTDPDRIRAGIEAEIAALRAAAEAADRVAVQLQAGAIPLVGRTEAEVSADLGRRLIDEGHQRVNFAIVAAGEDAASPHHEPGARVIQAGEVVLCDFGGTMVGSDGTGYCSDITRCVAIGEPAAEVAEAYAVLLEAQQAAVAAATVGTPCEEVDAVARRIIAAAGYGERFVHRTGHGIGVEEHEDPYVVAGNATPLVAGHAFSVEPGIYMPGAWGLRLEDIVVAAADGPDPLNRVDHALVVVDG